MKNTKKAIEENAKKNPYALVATDEYGKEQIVARGPNEEFLQVILDVVDSTKNPKIVFSPVK